MESKPIKFGLYGADNELIGLRDYMNIRNIDIKQAIEELENCNIVLVGHVFNVMFYRDCRISPVFKHGDIRQGFGM